jgi:CRISPR-associated exonuclease Cas4
MYSEDALLPISALQHLLFCKRQCALIHVEGLWAENRLTVEGKHLHKRAHEGPDERRGDLQIVRGLPLRSLRLGLVGKADVVEFEERGSPIFPQGLGRIGTVPDVHVTPIEYKRGQAKKDDSDRVQLCAQALCLEEMLGVHVGEGALFYGKNRRRLAVVFDESLRRRTEAAARELHELIASGVTPLAVREPKCDACSLFNLCLPHALGRGRGAAAFTDRQFAAHLAAAGPASNVFAADVA